MYAVVCLGNPGEKYEKTRHNVGFMIGQHLVKAHGFEKKGAKFKGVYFEGFMHQQKVLVLFPFTYMNLSGQSAAALLQYFKLPIENMLVVYDDLDLDFGELRLRQKGGPGTHNGMRSLVGILGKNFPRLRVGIGPKQPSIETSQFVLSNFSKEEQKHLPDVIHQSVDAIAAIYQVGIEKAMNTWNRKP